MSETRTERLARLRGLIYSSGWSIKSGGSVRACRVIHLPDFELAWLCNEVERLEGHNAKLRAVLNGLTYEACKYYRDAAQKAQEDQDA